MVGAVVKFSAAFVACDRASDRSNALNDSEAVRANVSVFSLHFAAFKRERVECLFAGNAEFRAGVAPLGAVWFDATASASFVGDEVSEFVLKSAPEFVGLAFLKFGIEFDGAVWPPGAAGGGLHAWVPRNGYLAGKFVKSEGLGGLCAPGA